MIIQETKPVKTWGGFWRKIWFCIPYKTHCGSDKHGSISFMIDNMHYVILRIWEDSVPWCGEIQNKRLEVLGNNLIFTPIPLYAQEVWSLNQFLRENNRVVSLAHTHHFTTMILLKIIFCMFLPFITNWLSNWAGLLGLSNWVLVCGLEWDQKGPIKH